MSDRDELQRELAALEDRAAQIRRELSWGDISFASEDFASEVAEAVLELPLVVWAVDRNGAITVSQGEGLYALGFKPNQLLGANVYELYDGNEEALEPIRQCLLRGKEDNSTLAINGHIWDTRYFPRFDSSGKVEGLVAISMDATELRTAQREAAHAGDLWHTLATRSPDYIVMVDRELNVSFINRVEEGGRKEDLYGQSLFLLFDERFHDFAREMLEATFRGEEGKGYQSSSSLLGDERWYDNRLAPIYRDGEVESVLIVSSDVTEQRQAELEKEQLRAQVLHTQKLESLGVLAGGIAHDFNNLLVGILGNAELASAVLESEHPCHDHIRGIGTAASRAAQLCTKMLAYAGKGEIRIDQVNLSTLVDDISQLLKVTLGQGVSMETDLDPGLWRIEADAAHMQQLVMNLITNAAEAMHDRSGTIKISTGQGYFSSKDLVELSLLSELEAGDYVYLEVEDSGHGMDEQTRSRMFDPFYTTKIAGRGLGLASVLGIIHSHRGGICVASEPNVGTTVKVLLPRTQVVMSESSSVLSVGRSDKWSGGGRAVLLVDDEPTIRRVAGQMLQALGFHCIEADNGEQAVKYYQSRDDIDIVLLDVTMPVMGGVEAREKILESNPDAKVVLSSGYAEAIGQDTSSTIVLTKPYRLSTLRQVLRTVLDE